MHSISSSVVLICAYLLLGTVAAAGRGVVSEDGHMKLHWTTDLGYLPEGDGQIGPDGPWQAVGLSYYYSNGDKSGYAFGKGWPSSTWISQVLTPEANRSNIEKLGELETRPEGSNTYNEQFTNDTKIIFRTNLTVDMSPHVLDAYTLAVKEWNTTFPNGRNVPHQAGVIGLGPVGVDLYESTSFTKYLKSHNGIASDSFSLHLGSAKHGQRGSCILGGYEQNRALGDVGVFSLSKHNDDEGPTDSNGILAFLRDVTLGVEAGGSPFNETSPISLFSGLESSPDSKSAMENTKVRGGVRGAAVVYPNVQYPYMYFPLGICEAAAEHLPVTWNASLGLYIWNTGDDTFRRVVSSPSYMAVVLSDSRAKNITIKVPFQVLNLTLESPIVDRPTQYFPCKPSNATAYWILGRAFLQSAFIEFNFDKSIGFIAQAPGPDLDQSIIRTLQPDDDSIQSNDIAAFARSWASYWVELPGSSSSESGSLSKAAIVGIVVGSVAGFTALVGFGVYLFRTLRKSKQTTAGAKKKDYPAELHDDKANIAEVHGDSLPVEIGAQATLHELPAS